MDGCYLKQCKIGDGSDIKDAEIEHTVIGIRSMVDPNVKIANTVMMGADYYETPEDKTNNEKNGIPNIGIGPGCIIDGAIIDKNARIGENVTIQKGKGMKEIRDQGGVILGGELFTRRERIIAEQTNL